MNINESAKHQLWEMMTSFSERMWSASWCSGLEFALWKKIRECSDDLTLRELADFNFYSGLAGGWWMWDEKANKEVFVLMDEWLEIFINRS